MGPGAGDREVDDKGGRRQKAKDGRQKGRQKGRWAVCDGADTFFRDVLPKKSRTFPLT